jgi:hypothetical protein
VQEKILARYGKVFDWSLKAKMMGKKATESARIFVEECGLEGLLTPEQFLVERESMLQELFPSCTALPGELTISCMPAYFYLKSCAATFMYLTIQWRQQKSDLLCISNCQHFFLTSSYTLLEINSSNSY